MAVVSPLRKQFGEPPQAGGGFNPYAAGRKRYGNGRPMPTSGKVTDKKGYVQRDVKKKARREALLRKASSTMGTASSQPGRTL